MLIGLSFTIFGTPDKVIGQFVDDVFGVLCIHTHQFNKRSNSCEVPGGRLTYLKDRRMWRP
jgi:hypothetical protein